MSKAARLDYEWDAHRNTYGDFVGASKICAVQTSHRNQEGAFKC